MKTLSLGYHDVALETTRRPAAAHYV